VGERGQGGHRRVGQLGQCGELRGVEEAALVEERTLGRGHQGRCSVVSGSWAAGGTDAVGLAGRIERVLREEGEIGCPGTAHTVVGAGAMREARIERE